MKKKLIEECIIEIMRLAKEWERKNWEKVSWCFDEERGVFFMDRIEKAEAPNYWKLFYRLKKEGVILVEHPLKIELG